MSHVLMNFHVYIQGMQDSGDSINFHQQKHEMTIENAAACNFAGSHVLTGCEFVWNRRLQSIDLLDFKTSGCDLRRSKLLQASSPGCPASSYDARILMSSQNHGTTCIECILSLSVSLLYYTLLILSCVEAE